MSFETTVASAAARIGWRQHVRRDARSRAFL